MRCLLSVIFCVLFLGVSYAQKKEKAVNLVFFDVKLPIKCVLCEASHEGQKKENAIIVDFIKTKTCLNCEDRKFEEYVHQMLRFADTSNQLTEFGKAQVYYRVASDMIRYSLESDKNIYNWNLYQRSVIRPSYELRDSRITRDSSYYKVIAGASEVQKMLYKSREFTTEEGKNFIDFLWLKYLHQSGLFSLLETMTEEQARESKILSTDDYFDAPSIDDWDYFLKKYGTLKIVQQAQPFIQDFTRIYQRTGFNPKEDHNLLVPSFGYIQSKTRSVGADLALDRTNFRNPYRIFGRNFSGAYYTRMSLLYLGMNQNLDNSNMRELYFGFARFSQIAYVYANVYQFGLKQNLDPDKNFRWFYRPEVGFSYGNFQVFYSYTHIFKKDVRPLAEKHALNVRITLPYLRVGRYDRY